MHRSLVRFLMNQFGLTPKNYVELENILKSRYRILMQNRSEGLPGEFKQKPIRVGNTHFVDPEYVHGTLN